MRILIANDDGVYADGINILAEELAKIAHVTVVAPDKERSAAGHGVTFFSPLRIDKISENEKSCFYSCSGTPADCVVVGLNHVMRENPPDLVIAGINRGPNLGDDFHYSGTIAAAVEGALAGIPSIAVSTGVDKNFKVPCYKNTARIASGLAEMVFEDPIPLRTFLNLNVPAYDIKGIKLTHLGFSNFSYGVIERQDGLNLNYFWLTRTNRCQNEMYEGSDYQALNSGYASITPLSLDFSSSGKKTNFFDDRDLERLTKDIQ